MPTLARTPWKKQEHLKPFLSILRPETDLHLGQHSIRPANNQPSPDPLRLECDRTESQPLRLMLLIASASKPRLHSAEQSAARRLLR